MHNTKKERFATSFVVFASGQANVAKKAKQQLLQEKKTNKSLITAPKILLQFSTIISLSIKQYKTSNFIARQKISVIGFEINCSKYISLHVCRNGVNVFTVGSFNSAISISRQRTVVSGPSWVRFSFFSVGTFCRFASCSFAWSSCCFKLCAFM